jgi:hypothetical protein
MTTTTTGMTVNLNTSTVLKAARRLGSVGAIVVGALESVPLPASVHPVLVAGGAAILAADHYIEGLKEAGATAISAIGLRPGAVVVTPNLPSGPPGVG